LRRNGNSWERLGGRVPEHASSIAGASASTPNLGGGVAVFWSASDLAELWIASEREHVRAAGRACSRACVIQSGRTRQHSKLGWRGGCVLECFRLGGALDRVGTGTRESGWESVLPSMRYPKRSQARKRQHSKLGWRVGDVLECFRLGGALDRAGAGTRGSGWEDVFPSTRHPKRSRALALQTWVVGRWLWSAL